MQPLKLKNLQIMTRIFTTLLLTLAVVCTSARTLPVLHPDSLDEASAICDSLDRTPARGAMELPDSDLVRIRPEGGELRLEIAGYGITLGNRNREEATETVPAAKRPKQPHRVYGSFGAAAVEIGSAMLVGTDYGTTWADDGDFLALSPEKSFHLACEIFRLRIRLDRDEHWFTALGLRTSYYDLVFNDKITLQSIDGVIRPEALEPSIKKSKLGVGYFGIPVGIIFSAQRLNISLYASGELLSASRLKYKKPKEKRNAPGIAPWRWTVGGSITYRKIGIYANYALTPLFKQAAGPETHTLSLGVHLGF